VSAVLSHHGAGVEFKLHPTSGGVERGALSALHREVTALALQCWLRLEGRRLGRAFPSARAYAEDPGDQFPESPPLLNLLLNLRADGLRLRARPSPWRHPRQRIFRSLVLLLWEPAASSDPGLRSRLETDLNTRAPADGEWTPAYRALWRRVR
jgi:hypothetical protein